MDDKQYYNKIHVILANNLKYLRHTPEPHRSRLQKEIRSLIIKTKELKNASSN